MASRNISLAFAVLTVLLVNAEAKNIFQKTQPGFTRIGSRLSDPRPVHAGLRQIRSADDRGAQNVYYVSDEKAVWGTAWMACRQAMNGDLLTIETQAEDLFVRDLLIKHNIASVWTSAAFDPSLGIWRWASTGGEVHYANWLAGQPSGSHPTLRAAVQNSLFSHGWATVEEAQPNSYICEVRSDAVPQPTPSTTTPEPPPPTPEPEPETTTYTHIDPPPPLGDELAEELAQVDPTAQPAHLN